MVHSINIKVRGYHLDVYGHVNNARYLEFLEEGRWAAFENKVDFQARAKRGYAFTVVNININYSRAAFLNEWLRVETEISRLGRHSGVVHQTVKLRGTETVVADADVTFVLFNPKQQRAVTIEGEFLELLQTI